MAAPRLERGLAWEYDPKTSRRHWCPQQRGRARIVTTPADGCLADDQSRLIFTCCHPALPVDARVTLTLRTVAGLTTNEIARAFLVPEAMMAKRLVRARAKVRHAGIP